MNDNGGAEKTAKKWTSKVAPIIILLILSPAIGGILLKVFGVFMQVLGAGVGFVEGTNPTLFHVGKIEGSENSEEFTPDNINADLLVKAYFGLDESYSDYGDIAKRIKGTRGLFQVERGEVYIKGISGMIYIIGSLLDWLGTNLFETYSSLVTSSEGKNQTEVASPQWVYIKF